jgi:predicted enzyme related to lactoylglutathione lyase
VLQDPQGAVIGLCRAIDGDLAETDRQQLGAFCWNQLNSSDAESAAAFYGDVLSWQRAPHPAVRGLSAFMHGTRPLAGLMQAPQGTFAQWHIYVSVERLDLARALTKRLGGTIIVETIALAGIGQISIIQDNVGTILGLLERAAE